MSTECWLQQQPDQGNKFSPSFSDSFQYTMEAISGKGEKERKMITDCQGEGLRCSIGDHKNENLFSVPFPSYYTVTTETSTAQERAFNCSEIRWKKSGRRERADVVQDGVGESEKNSIASNDRSQASMRQ